MKNHELLDMIGEVNEDYVLAADQNVARPRFGWKTLAACAACAALIAAAYPAYQASRPQEPVPAADGPQEDVLSPSLHEYILIEGGADTLTSMKEIEGAAGGTIDIAGVEAPELGPSSDQASESVYAPEPDPIPDGAFVDGYKGGEDIPWDEDGTRYQEPGQDAPVQGEAAAQYDSFLNNSGISGTGLTPEWYGGAWIDNDWPDNVGRLTVAIVDSFRTPELEARILDWCGGAGDVLFCGAKYSHSSLNGLMEPAVQALDGTDLSCGVGVDVIHNCLGVDIYGNSVPDVVLARLAALDPDGDAIRVRVFTQAMSTLTDEVKKGPAPDRPASDPVDPEARATPIDGSEPTPGGKTEPGAVQEGGAREAAQPAVHDLPESREAAGPTPDPAGYDIIYGAEG